jgi:hypothetical protein
VTTQLFHFLETATCSGPEGLSAKRQSEQRMRWVALCVLSVALCFPDSAAVSCFTILGFNPLAATSRLRTCARTARLEYSSSARAMAADEPELVVDFLTDLEGNLEYFDRWVAQSNAVRYKPGTTELELTHERAYFVFGGDLMDRFDGSLRLARRVVDLKK